MPRDSTWVLRSGFSAPGKTYDLEGQASDDSSAADSGVWLKHETSPPEMFGYVGGEKKDTIDRFSDLAPELLLKIFSYNRSSGMDPTPLSKSLLATTQAALYSQVHLRNERSLETFFKTLKTSPNLALLVFEMTLEAWHHDAATAQAWQASRDRVLRQLPNLHRLTTSSGIERPKVLIDKAPLDDDDGEQYTSVAHPTYLTRPRPALRHLELTGPLYWPPAPCPNWISHHPTLHSLALTVGFEPFPSSNATLSTRSMPTPLPSNPNITQLSVHFERHERRSHRALDSPLDIPSSVLASFPNVVDLRLVDHESDFIALSGQFLPAIQSALRATNHLLTSLEISTSSPALEVHGAFPVQTETRWEGYQDAYWDDSVPRTAYALNDALTLFPILTSLSLDGAAIDDRDLSFLSSLPLLQRLSFGAFCDVRLANLVSLVQSGKYPKTLVEIGVVVNRPFTNRPMWTGRRNVGDARRLLESVEGTRIRVGGDLRVAVEVQERWDEEASSSEEEEEDDDDGEAKSEEGGSSAGEDG